MRLLLTLLVLFGFMACTKQIHEELKVQVIQTSASGDKLAELPSVKDVESPSDTIEVLPSTQFQSIEGIGELLLNHQHSCSMA